MSSPWSYPLAVQHFQSGGDRIGIVDSTGRFIGEYHPESQLRSFTEDEARGIVLAVNAYAKNAELLSALAETIQKAADLIEAAK